MSMLPLYYEWERPGPTSRRLLDQHFGLGLTPQDNLTIIAIPQKEYMRSWKNLQAVAEAAASSINEDKDKYQVHLDVQHFFPEEISVKTADGFLIIKAKHDERKDEHGFVSRSFVRKYLLPDGVEAHLVTSKLSSDGVLSVFAPFKAPLNTNNERVVPIVRTGPVKKQVEETKNEDPKK